MEMYSYFIMNPIIDFSRVRRKAIVYRKRKLGFS